MTHSNKRIDLILDLTQSRVGSGAMRRRLGVLAMDPQVMLLWTRRAVLAISRVRLWGRWSEASLALARHGLSILCTATSSTARWLTEVAGSNASEKSQIGKWSIEEERLLREAVMRVGTDKWVDVANFVPGRSSNACRSQWMESLNPRPMAGVWSADDDAALARLVAGGKWTAISAAMRERWTPEQCRVRWQQLRRTNHRAEMSSKALSVASPSPIKEEEEEEEEVQNPAPEEPNESVEEVAWQGHDEAQTVTGRQDDAADVASARHTAACRSIERKWLAEEDEDLNRLVAMHGQGEWAAISAAMGGRPTKTQCRARWIWHIQRGDVAEPRTGPWSAQEDSLLREAVTHFGEGKWVDIASMVPGRSRKACWQHWNFTLNLRSSAGQWTAEENEHLRSLVAKHGEGKWAAISAEMWGRRTQAQCRKRWITSLSPRISFSPYTAQEDHAILALHERLGRRWAVIAKSLPGRSPLNVRDRHRLLMSRARRSSEELPVAASSLQERPRSAR